MDFPGAHYHKPVISCISREAIGITLCTIGGGVSIASAAWPTTGLAFYVPFVLRAPYPVARLWWANGVTNGSVAQMDCGVYSVGGTKIISTGVTTPSGTSVIQSVAVASLLGPGSYYMALNGSWATTAPTLQRAIPGVIVGQMCGLAQQSVGVGALPATATLASYAANYLPLFGIASAATI